MVGSMTETFLRRRIRHGLLLLLVAGVAIAWLYWQQGALWGTTFPTGYLLLGMVVVLAAYRLRKRWPIFRRFGSGSAWLHFHIYVGLAAYGLFWVHVGFRWPTGTLEQVLATVFQLISLSGFYGLYISRTYPRKLTAIGNEVIFEQIPIQRRSLVKKAEAMAVEVSTHSDILMTFVQGRLLPFLTQRRPLTYLLFPNGNRRRSLLAEVEALKRYLASEHQSRTASLKRLIQAKDDLDFHHALQGRLKGWLFIHVCLTAVLLVLSLVHTLLVHVFSGGF